MPDECPWTRLTFSGRCVLCCCRWQLEEIKVCPELTLNMSRWQLEELEKALGRSGCLYVWIDRVAVPQNVCELQRTLLARFVVAYDNILLLIGTPPPPPPPPPPRFSLSCMTASLSSCHLGSR